MKDTSQLLYDTWQFFKNHWLGIGIIIAPFIIPLNIAYVALEFLSDKEAEPSQFYWLTLGFGAVLYPLYQAAFIIYLASLITGKPMLLSQCYQLSMRFWPSLMLLYVLSTAAMAFGFAILLFPGFIVMARVAFAEFYCLFDGQDPLNAFSKSWESSKPYQWQILKGLIIIIALTSLPFWGIEYLLNNAGAWNPVVAVILGITSTLLSTTTTIFAFRIYTLVNEATDNNTYHL